MQELPVYPVRRRDRRHELDKLRDRFVADCSHRRVRGQSAIRALELQCVSETLRLTGVPVSLEEVTCVGEGGAMGSANRELIRGLLSSLEAIARAAARSRPSLEKSLVLEVHRLSCPPAGGAFRRGEARNPLSIDRASRSELIPDQVDDLIEWLAAESISKMHVTEKAALTFTRLMEISPFQTGNFRTAHLLLSYFALAEGYPPIFLRFEEAAAIRVDIERAMRFDTEPLVLRLSEALARSLALCRDVGEGVSP